MVHGAPLRDHFVAVAYVVVAWLDEVGLPLLEKRVPGDQPSVDSASLVRTSEAATPHPEQAVARVFASVHSHVPGRAANAEHLASPDYFAPLLPDASGGAVVVVCRIAGDRAGIAEPPPGIARLVLWLDRVTSVAD